MGVRRLSTRVLFASLMPLNTTNPNSEMMELRAKEPYRLTFDIKAERERTLSSLPVTFQVSLQSVFRQPAESQPLALDTCR